MIVIYRQDGKVLTVFQGYIARTKDNTIWSDDGNRVSLEDGVCAVLVAEQSIEHLITIDENLMPTINAVYPDDFTPLDKDTIDSYIDRNTGNNISKAIHPMCGDHETDGIVRDQIAQILSNLGQKPTAKFAKLQKVAIEQIAKGKDEKATMQPGLEE